MLHIVLFSFKSFYQKIFSCKVFDETMFDTSICLISCFPYWGFSRDKTEAYVTPLTLQVS
jgi:type IV secretory pathway TraG/TraD family ATPase VirD4